MSGSVVSPSSELMDTFEAGTALVLFFVEVIWPWITYPISSGLTAMGQMRRLLLKLVDWMLLN